MKGGKSVTKVAAVCFAILLCSAGPSLATISVDGAYVYTLNYGPSEFPGWPVGWHLTIDCLITDTLGVGNITSATATGQTQGQPSYTLQFLYYGAPIGGWYSPIPPPAYTGQTGRWLVTAINAQGQSDTALTNNLDRAYEVPLITNIRYSDTSTTPTFTWDRVYIDKDRNPSTPDAEVDSYQFRLYTGPYDSILATSNMTNNFYTVPAGVLSPGTKYYVRIVAREYDGSNTENRSDTFSSFTPTYASVSTSILDLNNDGKVDFLWRFTPSGALAYWLMDGVTITAGGGITTLSTDWQLEATPDLNSDGKADLIWRHTPTGTIAYWIMSGAAIASTGTIGAVDSSWRIAGMADFNADGKPDILWQHNPTGTVAVWYLNGTNLASSAVITAVGTDWQIAGTPDLNADGKPDVLWRQVSTGLVAYWLMDGITIQAGGGIATVPSNWHIVGTPDLNNDGKPDLLWHDSTTGTVSYWYMDGATILGGGAVTTVPAGWDIIAPR